MKRKHILILLLLVFIPSLYVSAQSDDIKKLFEDESYYTIVERYASAEKKKLTSQDLSHIGWSYYILGEDKQAIAYLSDAMLKTKDEKQLANLHYLTGLIFLSKNNYDEAHSYLTNAIAKNPEIGDYYAAMGNVYSSRGEDDKAIEYYQQGIDVAKPSMQAYYMLADTYDKGGKQQEALTAFYETRRKMTENVDLAQPLDDPELYITVLYNIGTIEMNNEQYEKAIAVLSELVEYAPDDYFSYTCLVQCCYAQGNYEMGDVYKEALYKAYAEDNLVGSEFADKFCVDNFHVENKLVSCYEFFQSTSDENATKVPIYIFYIVNSLGIIEAEIQYTYLDDCDGSIYRLSVLRVDKGESSSVDFAEDMNYPALKQKVKTVVSKDYNVSSYGF